MITLELDPEIEARLAAEAEARGLDLTAYAVRVLTEALPALRGRTVVVGASNSEQAGVTSAEDRKLTPEQAHAWIDRLAQFSDRIPALPGETFSREMIYQDHD